MTSATVAGKDQIEFESRLRFPRARRQVLTTLIYLVVIIGTWALYVHLANVPSYLLPSPESVAKSLGEMATNGQLWGNLGYTIRNILLGFVSGILIGVALGYLLWASRWASEIAAPYIVILQSAPKIAIAPLLVLWFGLGLESQLALILMLTFFPMMVAMQLGLSSISPDVRTLAQLLAMGKWRYFRTVQIPGAMPDLLSGAKIAIVDAMTGAFLAEFISAQQGLGFLMVLGNSSYNTPMLFAAVILTVAVGLLGFGAVSLAERRLLKWRSAR
ncbi:ABC transporter permease [Leifsonia poae]|uniref:ABC transporter permease n=1 Tax=Leifsonia poae TaxID=110933 RepID=UPI001CBECFE8|nr:ABC transporter permease [Leifsonia poae]